MGLLLLGMLVGMSSAIVCAVAGDISLFEGFLIYWIMGTVTPLLHVALIDDDLAPA